MEGPKRIIETFSPLERKVFPLLEKLRNFDEIVKKSGLLDVEVMRAVQWLKNKELVDIKTEQKETTELDQNGRKYSSELPEKKILKAIASNSMDIKEIVKKTGLEFNEASECIGILRKRLAIEINNGAIKITDAGKKMQDKEWLEEKFLQKLEKHKILEKESLTDEDNYSLNELAKRRGFIKIEKKNHRQIILTKLGDALVKEKIDANVIDLLTPSIISSKEWQAKSFRRYDIKAEVPKIFGGRKHHYRTFLDSVRKKFLALGFTELNGPIVESDFWNMDALYMPQFHSARDIHDAYYIKNPEYASDLPKDIVERVRQAHENGYKTGSTGWQYAFDLKRTRRNLLRTHDTAISSRALCSKNLKIPGKYFQMVRCFRYDVIDATHLADFNQVGGFVIEDGLTFKHLKGMLKMFAEEFAQCDRIKITPGYFPFTEPSAELHAKHPDLGWIELAGSGIFRPEMTKPLGIDRPVIAWGVGVDRLGMFNMGIKDIRDLFSHDLNLLRNIKII